MVNMISTCSSRPHLLSKARAIPTSPLSAGARLLYQPFSPNWAESCTTQHIESRFQKCWGKREASRFPLHVTGAGKQKCRSPVCRASVSDDSDSGDVVEEKPWVQFVTVATSLYPLYVALGSTLAILRPSSFAWFVERSPQSYSAALGSIMLAMGLTLRLQDLVYVLVNRPLAVLFGCAAQYGIMPLTGAAVARLLGLSPELSAGLILLACCPGGTASNVVTLIAEGDVPLSILMTICTTFGAVIATPLLTQVFAGAYVPVDVLGLAISTLQVVLVPVLLGAWLQSTWPKLVGYVKLFSPLVAVLISSLLSTSVFSANVHKIRSLPSGAGAASFIESVAAIAAAVALVHAAGFLLGYVTSRAAGLGEAQRRAISIEVGMQNSSLGVVLASTHFSSPLASVPAAISGVVMNIMASVLAVAWRQYRVKEKEAVRSQLKL